MKFIKNRTIKEGEKVFVYFNLHKKTFSIKALEGENKGKVVAHTSEASLRNCAFKVSEKGRERVLNERRKNVHAGIEGEIDFSLANKNNSREITYDPYKYSSFVFKETEEPVSDVDNVYFSNKQVFV